MKPNMEDLGLISGKTVCYKAVEATALLQGSVARGHGSMSQYSFDFDTVFHFRAQNEQQQRFRPKMKPKMEDLGLI